MNIASSFRMGEIDRVSICDKGYGNLILMENAGIRILEKAFKKTSFKNKSIVCVAGKGNNGGDALVVARQLFLIYDVNVSVVILKDEGTDAFNHNLGICKNIGVKIFNFDGYENDFSEIEEVIESASIIFDGIAGTGIVGELKGNYLKAVQMVNNSEAIVFSVDVPSGGGDDFYEGMPAVRANYTMTIGLPKRCLYNSAVRSLCGKIDVVRIGFPRDVLDNIELEEDGQDWRLADFSFVKKYMPGLQSNDYKNKRGHLAVFAGNRGTTGAASLVAQAASRTSAGLVSLFVSEDIYSIMATRESASIMVRPLRVSQLPNFSRYQAMAIGSGWGTEKSDLLSLILENTNSGVLDADALTILSNFKKIPNFNGRWILTPHIGEFKRLFPELDPVLSPYTAVTTAAKKLNAVVFLKGAVSFIASPDDRGWVIDGQYPKLGTAGSGDVLCGLIGGYLASGLEPFMAAVLGGLVHLKAGKKCGKKFRWFNAGDLLGCV